MTRILYTGIYIEICDKSKLEIQVNTFMIQSELLKRIIFTKSREISVLKINNKNYPYLNYPYFKNKKFMYLFFIHILFEYYI